jgi:hypothetical protein
MNPALAFMPKFFVISGAILVLSGLAQVFVRPRKPDETLKERLLNASTLRAAVFVPVGVLGVLLGLGIIPLPHLGGR